MRLEMAILVWFLVGTPTWGFRQVLETIFLRFGTKLGPICHDWDKNWTIWAETLFVHTNFSARV